MLVERAVAGSPRMRSWQLALLLVTTGLGLTSLNLALPVLPLVVTRATHEASIAGIVTAVVAAGTVALELQTSRLLRRARPTTFLPAAIALQMVAMAGFALNPPLPAMLILGGLTGAGFGAVATVTVNMVSGLAPPGRQGEAIGYYGLAVSTPAIIAPPVALVVLSAQGPSAVFLIGAGCCLAGVLLATRLTPAAAAAAAPVGGTLATLGRWPVLLMWLSFVCVTVTYGATVSFTPFLLGTSGLGSAPVFLLVFGITRATSRVLSGHLVDRLGDRRLALPGLIVGALALTLLPAHSAPLTIASAAVYGGAFGAVQTAAFFGMLRSAGPGRSQHISGIWNMAVDVGFGAGALLLAPLAASVGYAGMFWTLPVLFALSLAVRIAAERSLAPGSPRG